jgi:hypothetical protein
MGLKGHKRDVSCEMAHPSVCNSAAATQWGASTPNVPTTTTETEIFLFYFTLKSDVRPPVKVYCSAAIDSIVARFFFWEIRYGLGNGICSTV